MRVIRPGWLEDEMTRTGSVSWRSAVISGLLE